MLTRTTAHHATSYPPQWPRSGEIEAKSGGSGSRSKKSRRDFQAPPPSQLSLFAKLYRGSISFSSARASLQRASSGLLQGTIAKFYKMPEGVLARSPSRSLGPHPTQVAILICIAPRP